ncbi:MAG TPA: GNAT family N-acetyltransferase, partial [Verrucomicrobiae bacterium]|nr:GNAT family N-acetyltransferase [Verrucomicrobiae bacterium]
IAEFNIRLARETESKALEPERVRGGVEALINDPAKGFYFVAEADGEVAGQICVTFEWSDWRNGNFWWIQSVYVLAEQRGKGIFTALFQHVEKLARDRQDVCGLRLYVEQENHRAQQVYEKLGLGLAPYHVREIDFVLAPGDPKH